MFTEFNCVFCQPTLLSAPLACSCAFFLGPYGPPFAGSRTHPAAPLYNPQSLYGTASLPTVQSNRGSTAAAAAALKFALDAFQLAGLDVANGSPAASTWKKLTRFCVGWLKPQQPKWLPEYGKFRRSPKFALFPFGSPSLADAWYANMVSGPLVTKPLQTLSKLASSL